LARHLPAALHSDGVGQPAHGLNLLATFLALSLTTSH
jgi:hypothetical protein